MGRIVFAQTSAEAAASPEDSARRLGDAYAEAAHAIERSTVRIVHAQRRAEGHLNESYSGAIEAIHTLSARVTEQFDAMTKQVLNQFSAAIERIGAEGASTVGGLAAGTNGALRTVTEQMLQDFTRLARASAAELTAFVRQAHGSVAGTLQEFDTRVSALRLPAEDVGQRLGIILTDLTERAELLRRATAIVGAAYGELEGTLANAVQGARDGGRAFSALAVSADAATTAVTSAKTNVEQFATQLSHVGHVATGLETFPQEAATVVASLGSLRTSLGEANRAWADVAGVTDGATRSVARAGARPSSPS